ncbi:MAG: ATP-dependent zinc metalloprotease FtsH [Lachnospiraceae bacterium]|nr:ATP-dependent zinc metalloprotease FtsH [Lachnospiraceae bacterium]
MKNGRRGIFLYFLLILVVIGVWIFFDRMSIVDDNYNKTNLAEDIKAGKVSEITIEQAREVPTGILKVKINSNGGSEIKVMATSDVSDTVKLLESLDFTKYKLTEVPQESFLKDLLPLLLVFAAMFILFMIVIGRQNAASGGGGGVRNDFVRSHAHLHEKDNIDVNFTNVAGLQEEKEELAEIVDFLKAPQKYTDLGARIPKGLILVGPPGTGKTLLAKAVAGEAGVPFFSISGSDFVELYVGVGAARVRDLFAEAKKNAPCIVFIDEIDAVARHRGSGLGGGHDEREQTLNQLLVEMDGFANNQGIIVMAATNRVDILDHAIMRPGRFDRKVYVGKPDLKARREILDVHVKNKPLGDDVDLDKVAKTTSGFVGADLENLMNEAAIAAARDDRKYIVMEDIRKSFIKTGIGTEKKSRVVSEKERKITAYHEAGHAILFHVLPDVGPVYTVSIIPTGASAAGYTMPLDDNDDMFHTKGEMLQDIIVSLGGRVAEELIFDDITTGASQDIKVATKAARAMIMKYGMSENIGLMSLDNDDSEVYIGRDIAHTRPYGEDVAGAVDKEVKKIIDECHEKARKLINENIDVLHKTADLLLEKEKITKEEFEALFEA